mmetsp:Transcript_34586/g.88047  ORF Transcript_34586/g.88047 Transcript_34586/m.88047 type:complete len:260 (+) Transcript_34586:111-890(+)
MRKRDSSSYNGSLQGDDMGPSGLTGILPSSKVANLASDIEDLETKCNYLEQRNVWLTNRLLKNQQRFMEKTLGGNAKVKLRTSFAGWREALKEIRLESQLDQQTNSLDQCQQVARELGAALAGEQDSRRDGEAKHRNMKDDLQRAMLQERKLRQQYQDQQVQLDIMERRVQEAENCLIRSRSDAQAVIDAANNYESRRRDLEREAKDESRRDGRKGQANSLEYSIMLRNEANATMKQVAPLLGQHRQAGRTVSPERGPY